MLILPISFTFFSLKELRICFFFFVCGGGVQLSAFGRRLASLCYIGMYQIFSFFIESIIC
jgi:hypothetical protein